MTSFYEPHNESGGENFAQPQNMQQQQVVLPPNPNPQPHEKSELKIIRKTNLVLFKSKEVRKAVEKLCSTIEKENLVVSQNYKLLFSQLEVQLQSNSVESVVLPDVVSTLVDVCNQIKLEHKFPAIDLLRVVCFNEKNLEPLISSNIVPNLLSTYLSSPEDLGKGFKLMLFRLCANLFATKEGVEHMSSPQNVEVVTDSIVKALNEKEEFTLMGGASFAYNFSFHLSSEKNSDQSIQLLSCFVELINQIEDPDSNVSLLLIVGLGNLVYKNATNIELVSALQLNLDKFAGAKVQKNRDSAAELLKVLAN